MNRKPAAQVVSRALRRDVGVITRPFPKEGYSVHQNPFGASIWVNTSLISDDRNVRDAKDLYDALRFNHGWKVERHHGSSIIYVNHVPTQAERAVALAAGRS